jgi:hypothetical protein
MSDENELAEFSVVYTNRSLNHMSHTFQKTMKEISRRLKSVYNADGCALIPGQKFKNFADPSHPSLQVVELMLWKLLQGNMQRINSV